MRIVFPLLVVVIAAGIGRVAAVVLAATEPQGYARIMGAAHLSISAFGGTFLMMVALSYFIDHDKDVDWHCQIKQLCRAIAARSPNLRHNVLVCLAKSKHWDKKPPKFLTRTVADQFNLTIPS